MANVLTNLMDVIFGKPDVPDDQYEKAAAAEAARQARVDAGLAEINDVFSQYDQDFYDQINITSGNNEIRWLLTGKNFPISLLLREQLC